MKTILRRFIPLLLTVAALLPVFAANAAAAGLHPAMGLPNYRLIIGCTVGGALVVFVASALILKRKRK